MKTNFADQDPVGSGTFLAESGQSSRTDLHLSYILVLKIFTENIFCQIRRIVELFNKSAPDPVKKGQDVQSQQETHASCGVWRSLLQCYGSIQSSSIGQHCSSVLVEKRQNCHCSVSISLNLLYMYVGGSTVQ